MESTPQNTEPQPQVPAASSRQPLPQQAPSGPGPGLGPGAGAAPGQPEAAGQTDGDKVASSPLVTADSPLKQKILEQIQTVYDPGLIYEVNIKESGDVHVKMTLTSPACPSAQELPVMVRGAVGKVEEVKDVEVDVVFDPPWGPEKMSEDAKLALGMM
jgi:metal-sulfur cluster biosynthetic enzyme